MSHDGWAPAEPLPLSALQHYAYCPRQAALIHLDQVWDDNPFTRRGSLLHERVDEGGSEATRGVRTERALPLFSRRLGLVGKADAVEYHDDGRIVPVEYKSGRRQRRRADEIQLCAQALCLEEMLHHPVPSGAIFYFASRRRREVELTADLRDATEAAVAALGSLLREGRLPAPARDGRCDNCSLLRLCLPNWPDSRSIDDRFRPRPNDACASF